MKFENALELMTVKNVTIQLILDFIVSNHFQIFAVSEELMHLGTFLQFVKSNNSFEICL